MQMASALFLGIPGPKMVWQFGEVGYDYSIMFNGGRTAPKPVRWDYFDQPDRHMLYLVYGSMAKLRKSDAFRFGSFTSDLGGLGKRIWISHSSMNVVIAGNMGVTGFDMAPGFANAGQWYDYFSGETVTITDPAGHTFNFGPGEFRVFTSVPLPKPFHEVAITVKDSLTNAVIPGAEISFEGAGVKLSDLEGKALFTSFAGSSLITVKKARYKTWTKTQAVDGALDLTIRLKLDPNWGVEDPRNEQYVSVFPNPAHHSVTIESPVEYQVTFYSPDGRQMLTRKLSQPGETFDIKTFNPGLYILHFSGNGAAFAKKLLVE
jgi:hypothetical protein